MFTRALVKMVLAPALFLPLLMAPRAATGPTATQEMRQLTADMTGIYRLASLNSSGSHKEVLALVHQGRVLEVHARTVQRRQYLKRQVQARSAGVDLSPAAFDQLIGIAGGLNRSVALAPSSTRQAFLAAAGLAGTASSGPKPLVVPPQGGQCPAAYEPHANFDGGRKNIECRLKAEAPRSLGDRALAWWSQLSLIGAAQAYSDFRWTIMALVDVQHWGVEWTDNFQGTGVSAWAFSGFGFQASYFDIPGG